MSRTGYLSMSLLAAVLIATAVRTSAGEAAAPQRTSPVSTQQRVIGVFSGEFVNGVPVYRLPPVVVVAGRKAELARMEREELARAKQAPAKAAARPPA